jgi:hypothetical protein
MSHLRRGDRPWECAPDRVRTATPNHSIRGLKPSKTTPGNPGTSKSPDSPGFNPPSARTVYASRQVRMHQSHLSAVRRHLSESWYPAFYNGIEPDPSFETLADFLDRALGKRSDIKVLPDA